MQIQYPFILTGPEPGPTSIILAGVHGNESCGIVAFEKTIPQLKIECGKVIFVIGNPRAVAVNERCIDQNLNRMFRPKNELSEEEIHSYEYMRSREIIGLFDEANALLDIHSTRNPKSTPFIICNAESLSSAQYLSFLDIACIGLNDFHPGSTESYMHGKQKVGICIECGQHEDPHAINIASLAIHVFLASQSHTSRNICADEMDVVKAVECYKNSSPFTFTRQFEDFEKIRKGELIGNDGDVPVYAKYNAQILFPVAREKPGEECFVLVESVN